MGNLFELVGAVVFNMFMNVSILQGVELVSCPLVTGNGKDRVEIQLQLWKEGTIFQKNHTRGLLFMLHVFL